MLILIIANTNRSLSKICDKTVQDHYEKNKLVGFSWEIRCGMSALSDPNNRLTFMKLLQVWDDELAAMAQQWADRCSESHDNARNVGKFSCLI